MAVGCAILRDCAKRRGEVEKKRQIPDSQEKRPTVDEGSGEPVTHGGKIRDIDAMT